MNARVELARRKVKRASGLLREAASELARATGDEDVLGVVHVHDGASVDAASDLIQAGAASHGAVDVIVIARPTRARNTPTTASDDAKENTNGTTTAARR